MELEQLLSNFGADYRTLSQQDLNEVYESTQSHLQPTGFSNIFGMICSKEAENAGVSHEQYMFNKLLNAKIESKAKQTALTELEQKWSEFISSGNIETAKRQKLTADLIEKAKACLKSQTYYIKPNKTNVEKVVKWSSSRYAEYRKSEVVEMIISSTKLSENDKPFIYEFTSGSCSERGGLGGKSSYRLLFVLGVTLLVDDYAETVYRFNESSDQITEKFEKFELDPSLDLLLKEYESDMAPFIDSFI
ncbi:hypothetical protein DZF79_02900 [Vibrio parahaemolyticus]|nr:hypothetical protein [Vibrio parahaemolyticus]